MRKMLRVRCLGLLVALMGAPTAFAQPNNGLGQTIQIYTNFSSFVGRPSWLLMLRDVDHNQNIPYIYEFDRGSNFWLALSYGRNYTVVASTMRFHPYKVNPYRTKEIRNFCNLESNGRIIRGDSMFVTMSGSLTPNPDTYTCHVSQFPDSNFTVYHEEAQ